MTETQHNDQASQKSGQSIGFLRAAEKMQIATFEIPLTFLEDLGFSKDRIEAAKYMNRRFISGFYTRVRGIGEKLSFGRGKKATTEAPVAKAALDMPVKPAEAEAAGKAKKAEGTAKEKDSGDKAKPKAKA